MVRGKTVTAHCLHPEIQTTTLCKARCILLPVNCVEVLHHQRHVK